MDNVTFHFLEMLCKNVMLAWLPLAFLYVCWLGCLCWDVVVAGIFWLLCTAFFAMHDVIEALKREKKRLVKHEWKRNSNESDARTRALTVSPPDNAFDMMCHKMMHSWQLPLYCSSQEKALLLLPIHAHSGAHVRFAICQDHLDQPPTCWTQSPDKMDFRALSLYASPKQNVNNTRCPGEWLKLNTSSRSVCLASDPLWCHVVPLKLWKYLGSLSPVCSTTVMKPPVMNYTLLVLPLGMYVCAT